MYLIDAVKNRRKIHRLLRRLADSTVLKGVVEGFVRTGNRAFEAAVVTCLAGIAGEVAAQIGMLPKASSQFLALTFEAPLYFLLAAMIVGGCGLVVLLVMLAINFLAELVRP